MSEPITGPGPGPDNYPASGAPAKRPHETYVHGHHWRSRYDEADGAKLGMWLFLSTELLLFAGFFCAYAAFRLFYPDNWHEASRYYLDWEIGFINTCVLLLSSWTIVMAIRSAQLARKMATFWYLAATNVCAVFFLVTKLALEYWPKWEKGKLPGAYFNYPNYGPADPQKMKNMTLPEDPGPIAEGARSIMDQGAAIVATHAPQAMEVIPAAAKGAEGAAHTPMPHDHIFLSVYWISTATHGIHVLVGVFLITWLMIRTLKDHFGPRNFMALENVGLYWHVVDLIWIFLFPLMYLV
jgi:cytochrome c oxidase subunit III